MQDQCERSDKTKAFLVCYVELFGHVHDPKTVQLVCGYKQISGQLLFESDLGFLGKQSPIEAGKTELADYPKLMLKSFSDKNYVFDPMNMSV